MDIPFLKTAFSRFEIFVSCISVIHLFGRFLQISSNVHLYVYKTLPKISSKLCHCLEDRLSHEPLVSTCVNNKLHLNRQNCIQHKWTAIYIAYKTFWKKPKLDTYHNIVLQLPETIIYNFDVVIVPYDCLIKITWYAQQVRQKKALYNGHEEAHFNDPRWKDQVWYLVSG